MKKRKILGFITLILPLLAGCGGEEVNEYEESCKKALDSVPMLLDYSDGKELNIIESTREAEDMDAFLGLTELYWNGKTYDIVWEALPEGAWKIVPQTGDSEGYSKFTPLYTSEEFDCSLTATLSLKEGDTVLGSASATWNFKADAHISPDLSEYTYMSIKDINDAFYANKNAFGSNKYYTFGTITATCEQSSTHIYSGFNIQDGEYGLFCYQVYETQWFSLNPQIGDQMLVAGTLNDYGGLLEMYVYSKSGSKYTGFIDFAPISDARVQALQDPVANDITEMEWGSGKPICKYISALVDMKNVTFGTITATPKVGSHGSFTLLRGEAKEVINVSINYHIGATAYQALIDLINTWTPGVTKLNFHGTLSSYDNAIALSPMFGAESFELVE